MKKDLDNQISRELENDSTLIYAGMASYYKGSSRVVCFMRLTEETLYFKTSSAGVGESELHIPIDTITKIEKYNYAFLNLSGMKITTMDGCKRKFIVDNRDIWIEKITGAMERHPNLY